MTDKMKYLQPHPHETSKYLYLNVKYSHQPPFVIF